MVLSIKYGEEKCTCFNNKIYQQSVAKLWFM